MPGAAAFLSEQIKCKQECFNIICYFPLEKITPRGEGNLKGLNEGCTYEIVSYNSTCRKMKIALGFSS